ncbi:hypothetical protein CASFOL_016798 [Castilleja foliolosa]|uniref:NADH dehydrogenase [ubiquinone] 1 beta subcomplex subunit 9 n=1 Tax=Castilleja foliolosa TaxID=1961234 RepID=A0ABD3DD74_9LAMI
MECADALRERFETNKNVENIELIDRMIAAGEASYNKWRHPDPYIDQRNSRVHVRLQFRLTTEDFLKVLKLEQYFGSTMMP